VVGELVVVDGVVVGHHHQGAEGVVGELVVVDGAGVGHPPQCAAGVVGDLVVVDGAEVGHHHQCVAAYKPWVVGVGPVVVIVVPFVVVHHPG